MELSMAAVMVHLAHGLFINVVHLSHVGAPVKSTFAEEEKQDGKQPNEETSESKKSKTQSKKGGNAKKTKQAIQQTTDLPKLELTGTLRFHGKPLIIENAQGGDRLDMRVVFNLIASISLTYEEVLMFATDMQWYTTDKGYECLKIIDGRIAEVRKLYRDKVMEWLQKYIVRGWLNYYRIPPAHVAAVLVHMAKKIQKKIKDQKQKVITNMSVPERR